MNDPTDGCRYCGTVSNKHSRTCIARLMAWNDAKKEAELSRHISDEGRVDEEPTKWDANWPPFQF